jgi:predicted MFS family arabinose efflux permease
VDGIKAMIRREPLRRSLFLALQVSIAGAFVIVATVNFIKDELAMSDSAYAWVMAAFGLGSAAGAALYGKVEKARDWMTGGAAPVMIAALAAVSVAPSYVVVAIAWVFIGAGYASLGIRGSELLAANSQGDERPHVYAAHFALSHAGWGLTYPVAGFLTTHLGFSHAAWWFAGLLAAVSVVLRLLRKENPNP